MISVPNVSVGSRRLDANSFFVIFKHVKLLPVPGKVAQMNELQSANIILPHYQLRIKQTCLSTLKLAKIASLVIGKWGITVI